MINLKARLIALFLAVVFMVLSYTISFEIKPKTIWVRIVCRIVWVSSYVSGMILVLYALTVGLIQ